MIAKTVRIALMTAAAAALLLAADASAQSATSSFQVTASVAKNCVVSAADIAIPSWDPTSGTLPTQTGTVTVRCTRGTTYNINLNGGVYSDVLAITPSGPETLPFKFYAANCTSDFTIITATAPNRSAQNHTICAGLDPAGMALLNVAPAGNYFKIVNVDVTF